MDIDEKVWQELVEEVSLKDTGKISFLEFKKMMLKHAPAVTGDE